MMPADWRDALGALMPDLPEGSDAGAAPEAAPAKHKLPALHIEVDRKRRGKVATIIWGFDTPEQAEEAADALKRKLAVGGSARDGEVLLQGDCVARAKQALVQMGYKA